MNFKRLQDLYAKNANTLLPVKPGMMLEIHERVGDGDNNRIWKFKCLVLKVKKPNHPDGSFTVRGDVARMTIEKIYPLSFDKFEKVILLDDFKVRRSKLYYIRDKVGKDARMKSIISSDKRNTNLLDSVKVLKKETTVKNTEKSEENKEEKTAE